MYQDSYQEIFPIPLIEYLKENQLTNLPPNNQFNIPSDNSNPNTVKMHALPSINLDESSFIVIHQPDQNQYLDLSRVNLDNREKVYVLTEFKTSLTNNPSTSITIQHASNNDLSNINLMLSFSQLPAATPLPKLNTTTLNINTTLTSLNTVLNAPNSTIVNSINKLNSTNPVNASGQFLGTNATALKTLSTSELVSTNIEKPKDLAKNLMKNSQTSINAALNASTTESAEKSINKIQSNEELDNSTVLLNNGSYSSIGDDILNVNEFNRINPANLDLILDSLNDTTTDEINLNSTNPLPI